MRRGNMSTVDPKEWDDFDEREDRKRDRRLKRKKQRKEKDQRTRKEKIKEKKTKENEKIKEQEKTKKRNVHCIGRLWTRHVNTVIILAKCTTIMSMERSNSPFKYPTYTKYFPFGFKKDSILGMIAVTNMWILITKVQMARKYWDVFLFLFFSFLLYNL